MINKIDTIFKKNIYRYDEKQCLKELINFFKEEEIHIRESYEFTDLQKINDKKINLFNELFNYLKDKPQPETQPETQIEHAAG